MAGSEMDASLVQFFAEQCWLDAHARLLEAGADQERDIWLPDVFVDLEAKKCRSFASAFEGDEGPRFDERELARRRPDESTVGDIVRALVSDGDALPSRLVLLGGPGSGKSTITQMVELALRARALPRRRIEKKRAERVAPALDSAKKWVALATREVVPMRVVLPRLSRFIHEQPAATLGDFFEAESRGMGQECAVSAATITQFVRESPKVLWLFDGLDEVPETAGRAATIERAMRWVRKDDALIVTTRPQAYASEFDSLAAYVVQPLTVERAAQLGKPLVSLWSLDPERRQERVKAFEAALSDPNVRELASSPLQTLLLAIMFGATGALPKLRAELYRELFSVLFQRETQKPNRTLTKDDEGHVLALHRRAGIALQVRGARSTGSTATLSAIELRRLIVDMLIEHGEPDERAATRSEQLMEFATNRLVLLERSSDREFSFAVRSVQEYFAADALIDHEEPRVVAKRVAALAPHYYWRNTVRFVASIAAKMERKNERPTAIAATVTACDEARAQSALAAAGRLGEWVACEQLEALPAGAAPWMQSGLWDRASEYRYPRWGFFVQSLLSNAWSAHEGLRTRVERQFIRRLEAEPDSNETQLALAMLSKHPINQAVIDAIRSASLLIAPWLVAFCGSDFVERIWGAASRPASTVLTTDPSSRSVCWGQSDGLSDYFEVLRIESFRESTKAVSINRLDGCAASTIAACVAFARDPSAERLATVLDAASRDPEAAFGLQSTLLPWPIDGCLRWADNQQDLELLADAARSGRLGDADYFHQMDQLLAPDDTHLCIEHKDLELPWSPAVDSMPLAGRTYRSLVGRSPINGLDPSPHSAVFFEAVEESNSFDIPLGWIDQLPLRHARRSAILLSLDLLKLPHSAHEHTLFTDFADRHGRARNHACAQPSYRIDQPSLDTRAASLAVALLDDPARDGLWNALFILAQHGCPLPYEQLASLPPPVGPNAIDHHALAVFAGWSALREDEPKEVVDALVAMLHYARVWSQRREDLLAALIPHAKLPSQEDALAEAVRATMNKRPIPVFATPERWTEHQLPGPFPHVRGPRPPVILRSIDAIENIRVFAKTPAFDRPELARGGPADGQWIVVIGENGSGKTTFLRALAFALATPAVSTKLVTGHPSFIRNGGDGVVGVTLEETPLRVRLRRDETFVDETEPYTTRPWVVGYGVQRGAASDPGRAVLNDETGALGSLFDMPYALTNAKSFLSRCDHNALSEQRKLGHTNGPKNRLWNELRAAMQRLLGVHAIEVDDGVWVRVREGAARVSFDTLSHGYLAMAGWVSDMVARWLERIEKTDDEYPANIFATMAGVALVDEIDLHLHPRWQLTVIDELRSLFPRMTFIATTHNPLTLHGAKPGEIFVLTKNEHGEPTFLQRDIRPGSDVDRVLFDVFGMHQTFDKRTREMLDEHRAMVARGVAVDAAERVALERELRDRLGAIGDLVSEQRGARETAVVTDATRRFAEQRAEQQRAAREAASRAEPAEKPTRKPSTKKKRP